MAGESKEQLESAAKAEARRKDAEMAAKWLKAIDKRRDAEKQWRETRAPDVIKRYRDERGVASTGLSKFNILWANVETMKPAIFAKMPIPDCRRRFITKDPIARTAALIMERALSYCQDTYNFQDTLDRCNEDTLLPGRAECIIRYKPYLETRDVRTAVQPLPDSDERSADSEAAPMYPPGTQFDAAGPYSMQPREELVYQEVYADYVPWDLLVFGECRTWQKVPWLAVGALLTREELKAQYPEFDSSQLSFTYKHRAQNGETEAGEYALIWDVWHKASRMFIVVAAGYTEGCIYTQEDPLHLEDFYPVPEPIYAVRTNKDWTPIPEYTLYQDQANELDEATERLSCLTNALKVRGVSDQSFDNDNVKLSEIFKASDLTIIPIAAFRSLVEKGGLKSIIDTLPIEEIANVIDKLTIRVEWLKQVIYELTGISDVVRGATKASETLGAQQLKAKYAGMRISSRQNRFARFIRDIYRIKAEIIAEHFDPQTLKLISGLQVVPDQVYLQAKQQQQLEAGMTSETEFNAAIAMLKSDKLRGFKIDVEADSTIPEDKTDEQEKRVQFITAVSQYLANALPAVQQGLLPAPIAREGLLFAVRAFKTGSEFEEVLEQLGTEQDADNIRNQLKQLQGQAQQLQEQNKQLTEQNQELQSNQQIEMQKAQAKAQTDQFAAEKQAALDEAQAAHQRQLDNVQAAHEGRLKQIEFDQDANNKQRAADQDLTLQAMQASIEQLAQANESQAQEETEEMKQVGQALEKLVGLQEKTLDGIGQLAQAVAQLAQQHSAPKTKKGRATLPSGGTIEFETSEGIH